MQNSKFYDSMNKKETAIIKGGGVRCSPVERQFITFFHAFLFDPCVERDERRERYACALATFSLACFSEFRDFPRNFDATRRNLPRIRQAAGVSLFLFSFYKLSTSRMFAILKKFVLLFYCQQIRFRLRYNLHDIHCFLFSKKNLDCPLQPP